jgi:hypothetical protein
VNANATITGQIGVKFCLCGVYLSMPSRLRSAAILCLLAVFFFNTCVFGLALSAELYLHQRTQLEKIKNKKHKDILELRIDRSLIELRNEQFQWEKDWEFRWQGEMYDIEDSYLDGNMWVFHVKHDTKEDMLRKKMERHAQDENTKRNSQLKKNLKGSEYFEPERELILTFHIQNADKSQPLLITSSAHPSLPDPPPWLS